MRLIVALIFYCTSFYSFAFELVRDAEIEEYLYDVSKPIFRQLQWGQRWVNYRTVRITNTKALGYSLFSEAHLYLYKELISKGDKEVKNEDTLKNQLAITELRRFLSELDKECLNQDYLITSLWDAITIRGKDKRSRLMAYDKKLKKIISTLQLD